MASKLGWRASLFFEALFVVAALILLGFATLYPLSRTTWHRLFWSAWGGGVAVSIVMFSWGRPLSRAADGTGTTDFRAVGGRCFRSLVRGLSLGGSIFALLALANGFLARGEIEESQGELVAKHQHRGRKHGPRYYSLDVRHLRTGEVFRISVTEIDYELSRIGADRQLRTREGALGWLYRVR